MPVQNPTVDESPQILDLVFSRTADVDLTLTVTDDLTGAAEDLSGLTFSGTVKSLPDHADDEVIALTVEGDASGQLVISAASSLTTVSPGEYVYEVWQTAPTKSPWLAGQFTIVENVL